MAETRWQGVTFDDLSEAVGLAKPPAPYIMAHCDGGYTTNLAVVVVDDKGNLRVPADYRTSYRMLGSRAVAKDDGPGSKEMHVVYASPGTSPRIVRRTLSRRHRSREGSVQTTTKDMTTGTVSSAGTLAGWFVMLKDNVGRFSGNKLWSAGSGWSWFDATKALFHLRFRKLHMPPGMRCRTGFPQ
jgi:hypothetical protein